MQEEQKLARQSPVRHTEGLKRIKKQVGKPIKKKSSQQQPSQPKTSDQQKDTTFSEEVQRSFQAQIKPIPADEVAALQAKFTKAITTKRVCKCCFQTAKLPALNFEVEKEDHLSWFYKVAFCKGCSVKCHLMCVGRRELHLLKTLDGTDVLLFECDGCKSKEKWTCEICSHQKGFVREINGKFVHQICALAFSYPLLDPFTMKFGQLENLPIADTNCKICDEQKGGLVRCQNDHEQLLERQKPTKRSGCDQEAHPFCALNHSKENRWVYQVVTAFKDALGNYLSSYSRDCSIAETTMRFICETHKSESLYATKNGDSQMLCFSCAENFPGGLDIQLKEDVYRNQIQCEFCDTWFHQICLKHEKWRIKNCLQDQEQTNDDELKKEFELAKDKKLKGMENFRCAKCLHWNEFLKSEKVKTLLGLPDDTLQVKLNGEAWRGNWMLPNRIQIVESRIIEQIFGVLIWVNQCSRIKDFKCSPALVERQIAQSSLFLFNLTHFTNELRDLLQKIAKPSKEIRQALELAAEKSKLYKHPFEIIEYLQSQDENQKRQFSVIAENDAKNQRAIEELQSFIARHDLEDKKMLTDGHLEIELFMRKVETLNKAKDLLFKKQLIQFQDLQEVLKDFDELGFKDCHSYKLLLIMQKMHIAEQREVVSMCQMKAEIQDEIRYQLKKMRERFRGLELAKQRYKYLKAIFNKRRTLTELKTQLNRDTSNLATEMASFKKPYLDKIEQIENYFKRAQSYISKAADKPLQRMLELLVQLASQPVKPDRIDLLLEIWLQSAEWNAYAKSFIIDKLKNKDKKNSKRQDKKEEPGNSHMLGDNLMLGLTEHKDDEKLNAKFIFSADQIQTLIDRTKLKMVDFSQVPDDSKEMPIVFDVRLLNEVEEKFALIKDIQACEEDIRLKTHNTEDLQKYIEACQGIQNFDLSREVKNAETKLVVIKQCLVATQVNQGEGSDEAKTQSLRKLQMQVQELKCRGEDPIFIPEMLELMLESKVQISEQLKREFQETLQNCSDSFNKQMIIDLRKIVQKATKEHGLTMEKERRIVDNLGRSEEWFVETFAQLKRLCGHALHQIDFKDYQQLHSVIKNARDCDMLLKAKDVLQTTSKVPLQSKQTDWKPQLIDSLVGAAKNLYLSLQGAKWLFEVKALLDRSNGVKDFSQMLNLYYRSKEINIDLSSLEHQEVMDDDPNFQVLSEFIKLSRVAVEFDSLFGTHQKVIETLERYERDRAMQKLLNKVDSLQEQLLFTFSAQTETNADVKTERGCVIQTLSEQEVLQKVRSYIRLNQDYQNFISNYDTQEENKQRQDFDDRHLFNEMENPESQKISYAKALRLQQQARASQIPEDIPVLKRLNQSIQRFEKFKKQCTDYARFRDRIRQKGAKLLSQSLIQQSIQAQTQKKQDKANTYKNPDAEFSLSFVNDLVTESVELDIEIPFEIFQRQKVEKDLQTFFGWKEEVEDVLRSLESELQPRNFRVIPIETEMEVDEEAEPRTTSISQELLDLFTGIKDSIKDQPLYDRALFVRIQAFDWLLSVKNLVDKGSKDSTDKFIYSLPYWENLQSQQEQFYRALPILKDHPVLQRMIWEIERARQIVEFVNKQRHIIKSNQGKFLSDRYQNYVAFRTKHTPAKIESLLALAIKTKVDLAEEIQLLQEWLTTFNKYQEMVRNKTLFTQNKYEQVKLIQKQIYLSPIEYGDLYFTIGKRLEIAQQIRVDLKNVIEEQTFQNQRQQRKARIKYSRVAFDLNHFEKNCQIPGIQEVEKIQGQIASSRVKIAEALELLRQCEDAAPADQIALRDSARKITKTIEIDMEEEEQTLIDAGFKLSFKLWTKGHQKLDVEQIKLLDKDFKKVQDSISNTDQTTVQQYLSEKENVIKCLKFIKRCENKEELRGDVLQKVSDLCPYVDFEQQISDKLAELHLKQKQISSKERKPGGTISVGDLEPKKSQSSDAEESSSSSEDSSESSESEESSEEVIVFKKGPDGQIIKVSSKEKSSSSSGSSSEGSSSSSDSSSESEEENSSDEDSSVEEESGSVQKAEQEVGIIGRKRKADDEHIYQDEDEEAEMLEAKFNSLTEEQKQFLDEQLRKREQKKREKAAAKLAAQQFEAQQAKQQKIKDARKTEEENPNEHLGLRQDQSLMQSIQSVRDRQRAQCKDQIVTAFKHLDDCLLNQPEPIALFQPSHDITKQEIMTHFIEWLESKVFEKYPQIDVNYRRKITDICANIKQIHSFPEIAELVFNKYTLSCFAGKVRGEQKSQIKHLFQGALFFKDHLTQQQRLKDERRPLKKVDALQILNQKTQKVDKTQRHPQEVDGLGKSGQSFEERISSRRGTDFQSGESSGEVGAGVNTSARFSDEEDQGHPSKSMVNQFDENLRQMYVPHQMYKYNPFLVLSLQSQQKSGTALPFNLQQQASQTAPQSEPILYDPIKHGQSTTANMSFAVKNVAKPGSLLKVWDGQLQTSSTQLEHNFQVQLFSTGDIRNFQSLPDFPSVLTLKGKSVLKEVMQHFIKLRHEIQQAKLKKTNLASHFILKGWATRKVSAGVRNSDNYSNHFDTLEQNMRCSVCPLFKGLNIYLVPVIAETKLFCKQMGVVPLKSQQTGRRGLDEETQYFAFFCHIKQTFNKKLSFLNPSVICHLEEMQRVPKKQVQERLPLPSKQSVVINLIQPAFPQVKNEQMPYSQMYEPEDEYERELDRLIALFRTQGITNIEEIQQNLLPIIEKFSGTGRKEEKLEAFLKEVIDKINSQQNPESNSHSLPSYAQPQFYQQPYGQYGGPYMPGYQQHLGSQYGQFYYPTQGGEYGMYPPNYYPPNGQGEPPK